MVDRVACAACGAHRDRALPHTEICFVCGSGEYVHVLLNVADVDAAIKAAIARLAYLQSVRFQLRATPRDRDRH